MSLKELEAYIHNQIPLTKAMKLTVESGEAEGFKFRLPLEPNRNHQNTVFGGTLLSAQALICWAWLTTRLQQEGYKNVVVIRKSESRFLLPVDTEFEVQVVAPPAKTWREFLKKLREGGKAKISMEAEVYCRGRKSVTFHGEYVAVPT